MTSLTPNQNIVKKADITEINRAISVLFKNGDTVELRALRVNGKQIHAGYFRDFNKLATEAARLSGQAGGVYCVLNQINPALYARAADRIEVNPENLTQDVDIRWRRYLPFDVDPIRPAGISSSDDEHEAAIHVARAIRDYLLTIGIEHTILGDSGNGGHTLGCINLPNNEKSLAVVTNSIKAIAGKFNNEVVHIDQTVFNAARVWKLPGTLARKGDNIPERPHRISKILEVT